MKIVVLCGGISTERAVSLVTGVSVCKALRRRGHKAILVDMFMGIEDFSGCLNDLFESDDGLMSDFAISRDEPDLDVVKAMRKDKSSSRIGKNVLDICSLADCVFLGLHGADGEDGKIQGTLELMGIPYTASNPLASAMAMDKAVSKIVMDKYGILTPEWREFTYTKGDIPALVEDLPVPCAIKVVNGGSSIGVALPETKTELLEALEQFEHFNSRIIWEKKIIGRELTQPVLGENYLPAIEIVPPESGKFDYVAKYQAGSEGATEICPAEISAEQQKLLGETALKLHKALGLSVYSRSDFILDKDGNAWCLEVNNLPGMTPASLVPKAAAAAGIEYDELCEKIIELSLAD